MTLKSRLILTSLFLLLFKVLVFAQRADRINITGIVTDPTGNAIPNANVHVRNELTGVDTPLTSNEVGLYTSPLLVIGTYTVTVDHPGFKTVSRTGIQTVGGETYRVDLRLELGTITDKVEVSA